MKTIFFLLYTTIALEIMYEQFFFLFFFAYSYLTDLNFLKPVMFLIFDEYICFDSLKLYIYIWNRYLAKAVLFSDLLYSYKLFDIAIKKMNNLFHNVQRANMAVAFSAVWLLVYISHLCSWVLYIYIIYFCHFANELAKSLYSGFLMVCYSLVLT